MFLFQLSCTWPSLIRHHEQKISVTVSSSAFGAVSSPCGSLHTSQQLCSAHRDSKGLSIAVSLRHPFPFSALALCYGLDPQSSRYLWPSPPSPLPTINFKSAWRNCVWSGRTGLCISQKVFFAMQQHCPFVWRLKSYGDMAKKGWYCPRSKPAVEVMQSHPTILLYVHNTYKT